MPFDAKETSPLFGDKANKGRAFYENRSVSEKRRSSLKAIEESDREMWWSRNQYLLASAAIFITMSMLMSTKILPLVDEDPEDIIYFILLTMCSVGSSEISPGTLSFSCHLSIDMSPAQKQMRRGWYLWCTYASD